MSIGGRLMAVGQNRADSRSRRTAGGLCTDREFIAGSVMVLSVAILAILAPVIAPFKPAQVAGKSLLPPSREHFFGTDSAGFDVFSRILYAARVDLGIAVGSVALAMVVGILIGILAGWSNGILAQIVARVIDTFQAMPALVISLGLAAVVGASPINILLIVAFVNVPVYFRISRSQTVLIKESPFVEFAVVARIPRSEILTRHVLRNQVGPLLSQGAVNCGWALLLTAALSFIGAGIQAPNPEWGTMIAAGANDMSSGHWWLSVIPGLAIIYTALGFGLMGEAVTGRVRGIS